MIADRVLVVTLTDFQNLTNIHKERNKSLSEKKMERF